jgi:hypothetical protein
MTDQSSTRILIATIALIVVLAWARFPWEAFAPAYPVPR